MSDKIRPCCICGVRDIEPKQILNVHRCKVLQNVVTAATSKDSRAHKSCLERLGMGIVPTSKEDRAAFAVNVARFVTTEVQKLITDLPHNDDIGAMCDAAWEKVQAHFMLHNPTAMSVAEMERLIRFYVTKSVGSERQLMGYHVPVVEAEEDNEIEEITDRTIGLAELKDAFTSGVSVAWMERFDQSVGRMCELAVRDRETAEAKRSLEDQVTRTAEQNQYGLHWEKIGCTFN